MKLRSLLLAAVVAGAALSGCATSGGEGSASIYVRDAPTDEFDEIHVVFTDVYIHEGGEDDGNETDEEDGSDAGDGGDGGPPESGLRTAQHGDRGGQENQFREEAGWINVAGDPDGIDVDLLNASGTRAAFLGEANLTAGTYTQIAVVVADAYGITDNGTREEITVPSGVGRIVESFEIQADVENRIILDLDLDRAMTESGGQGWKLTPVFGNTVVEQVDDEESGAQAHEEGEIAEVGEDSGEA